MSSHYLILLIVLIFGVINPGRRSDQSISTIKASSTSFPDSEKKPVLKNKKGFQQDTTKARAVSKVISELPPDLVIQVGAFSHEANATAFKIKLSDLLNQKVVMVPVDGFFKVRIEGCKTFEEMGKLIQALGLMGIKNVWVFRPKIKEELQPPIAVLPDTSKKTVDTIKYVDVVEEEKVAVPDAIINLQIGVFHEKSEATQAQKVITSKLNLPVEIIKEWEYYIVFITGFKTREEIFSYYPKLAALGYPDCIMIEKSKMPVKR
jgi:hypothetical protein